MNPRGQPSHPGGAVLRPPCALETPEELGRQIPGSEEIPFGQGAAGDAEAGGWEPHFGRHAVTGAAPHATRGGLDPSLGSCAASLHWKTSLEKLTGEESVRKSSHHIPQGAPGL